LEDLYISEGYFPPYQPDDINVTQWLDLFQPFTSVKNLYLAEEYASVLQEFVGERVMGVLPMLENIFLEGFRPSGFALEAFEQFMAAGPLSATGRRIVISDWERTAE